MIIHVEKTLNAMTGEMCGNDLKKNMKITKQIKNILNVFFIPRQRYKIFRYILQKQKKKYLVGSFSSNPTYLVKKT